MDNKGQFNDFLADYLGFYKSVEVAAKEKLDIVLSYNLAALEKAIATDEATIMRARQFEKERIELQKRFGYGDCTLKEIMEQEEPEGKGGLTDSFNELSALLENIRFYNKKSSDIINDNLLVIKKTREISKKTGEHFSILDEKA